MTIWIVIVSSIFARLPEINQPYVDANSWREADVAMIAENLSKGGFDILHPQIDWSPDTTGVVGTEFPLVSLLAAALDKVFGTHDWIGRAIPVVFFCASMPCFFLLVTKLSSPQAGVFSLAFYGLTPLGIEISRSFMPDAVALSLAVMGLYAALAWVESLRTSHLMMAALSVSGAILVKAPYAMILLPTAYVLYRRFGWRAILSKAAWFLAAVALIPSVLWYAHAWQIPTATLMLGGQGHFFGEQGVGLLTWTRLRRILDRNFWTYFTPISIVPAIIGLLMFGNASRYGKLFHFCLLAMAAFIVFVGPGNRDHPWYQLPVVPITSAFAGYAIALPLLRIRAMGTAIVAALLVAVLGEVAYYKLKPDYDPWNAGCMEAAEKVDQIAPAAARVLVTDEGDPSCMYYSRRKGWHFWTPAGDSDAIAFLERSRTHGADYLIVDEFHLWWLTYYKGFEKHLEANYVIIARSKQYALFDLTRANSASVH